MTLVNTTPHNINIILNNGDSITLPTSGMSVRVSTQEKTQGIVVVQNKEGHNVGIDTMLIQRGSVEGLPPEQHGIQYIVSTIVQDTLPERTDLLTPYNYVRDNTGRILGCRSFSRKG